METLGFNQTQARQNQYMSTGYHGIGAQISANYANTLEILNAESYDDGRGTLRYLEQRQSRLHQMSNNTLSLGMVESNGMGMGLAVRANSEEFEKGTKRKKKRGSEAQNDEDEDEARKKARGRPRVDTKDETAADVSTVVFSRRITTHSDNGLKKVLQPHRGPSHLDCCNVSRDTKFETTADFKCSGEELRYGWLREPTDTEKRLPLPLSRSRSRITKARMRR
jgi:hypothetical protein